MSRRETGYVSAYTTVQAFANTYGTASGGTAVTIGGVNYQYVSFTATGSFTPTTAGLFDVLIFGGGCGGMAYGAFGGGGGAGGILQQTIYLPASATTVSVGAGGSGTGNYSAVGSIPTAVSASGGSMSYLGLFNGIGVLGGYAGASDAAPSVGQNNTQGYQGGASTTGSAGGGGGTTAQGSVGSTNTGGAGGAGFDVSAFIGGSALFKGAGGGGGGVSVGGAGGSGVGGTGQSGSSGGSAAAANTASGGGGRANTVAYNGGSGIVYIRWKV